MLKSLPHQTLLALLLATLCTSVLAQTGPIDPRDSGPRTQGGGDGRPTGDTERPPGNTGRGPGDGNPGPRDGDPRNGGPRGDGGGRGNNDNQAGDNQNPNPPGFTEAQFNLGQALFFDKILSGNRNISCASCHHPATHSSDDLSLSIGEGGEGLGRNRSTGAGEDAIVERVPRNSPALFNLGDNDVDTLFHDGRVSRNNSPSGFASPAGDDLPSGLNSLLAVQAMFPVTSPAEMAGQGSENEIALATAAGDLASPAGVWELLAQRLREIPAYLTLFAAAYPDEILSADDINFVQAANAIAAFETLAFTSRNSPFDRQQNGEQGAMSDAALRGQALFANRGCAGCHSGPLQSDGQFHAIAMPQIGPGKGDNSEGFIDGHEDFGRERVSGDINDRFKFRTPSLRNVELTAPYGHSGAYDSLEAVVRHYINPRNGINNYDRTQAALPSRADLDALDFVVMDSPERVDAIADAAMADPRLRPRQMSAQDVNDIVAFLRALTDPDHIDMSDLIPASVPSGLPLLD